MQPILHHHNAFQMYATVLRSDNRGLLRFSMIKMSEIHSIEQAASSTSFLQVKCKYQGRATRCLINQCTFSGKLKKIMKDSDFYIFLALNTP